MSGAATRMYALKPVVSLPEKIALPNVMYELPRIQGGGGCYSGKKTEEQGDIAADIADQVIRFSKVSPLFSHSANNSTSPRSSHADYNMRSRERGTINPPVASCIEYSTHLCDGYSRGADPSWILRAVASS